MKDPDISSEYREHEKYVKFFTSKVLHSVVQSRSGLNTKTKCNAFTKGRDWFNIALTDCESTETLQNVLREKFGKKAAVLSSPISIDIILKNMENKFRIIESWCLKIDATSKDNKARNHFSVYNRLGVLLRSVISISRILPSYRLSRRGSPDFNLFWRLKCECYSLNDFELCNNIEVGSVCTPIGTIKVNVLYQNKIELTDFERVNLIASNDIADGNKLFPLNQSKSITKFSSVPFMEKEIASAVSDTELSAGFIKAKQNSKSSNTLYDDQDIVDSPPIHDNITSSVIPAFADVSCKELPGLELPELSCTTPFYSLLNNDEMDDNVQLNDIVNRSETKSNTMSRQSSADMPKQAEAVGFEDDFVLVELRPAFCSENDSLGCLYKEWKNPIPLDLFATLEQEDSESDMLNITAEIEKYKSELEECRTFFLNVN